MLRAPTALLATALSLAVALALAPAALAQGPSQPTEHAIGLLFTETAKGGTLTPVKGTPRFTLTLHGVARQVVWFSDRPARKSGQIPTGGFARKWAGFGFSADRPNAALTLLDAASDRDTAVLKLGKPRYLAKTDTIRYSARILDEATGNLSHFESQRDRRVPRRFGTASLFIDDATAPVINGCVIEPYVACDTKQLGQENGTGAVTIFNPTGTAYNVTVNGVTRLSVPASTPTAIPRSSSGSSYDGQFGWNNVITVSPMSGGGSTAQANIPIPEQYQTFDDFDLYLFYGGDFSPPSVSWVLLYDGDVVETGS